MMLPLTAVLCLYAIVGLAVLLLTTLSKSHRALNLLAVALSAAYLTLTLFTLASGVVSGYALGGGYFLIDHLSLYEILISAVLFLLAAIYSRGYIEGSIEIHEMDRSSLKLFYFAFDALLILITYAFLSDNLALFWILAELTTAFSGVLIVMLNAPKNIGATLKYIFITSTCMLFSFVGLILIFTLTQYSLGEGTLNWSALINVASTLSPSILFAAFIFTFVGFAAKSGVVPFHAWLPSAHSKAPASISAILSGSITSVGIYGIIRIYSVVAQTSVVSKLSWFLIAFGLVSMTVAVLTMLTQVNLKKLIGYSTVENMGFLLVGLGLGTPVAVFWTLFYTLAHAFTKASLFLSAGIIHHQFESVRMERIKNAFQLQPFASWSLILGAVAIIGMPLSAIFVPKIAILMQAAALSPFLLGGLLTIFLFVAAAFGVFLIKILTQKEDCPTDKHYRAPLGMKLPIVVLLFAVFVLGVFFPQQLNNLLQTIVNELGIR
jgi:hydrogenase-4 component F